MDISNHDSSFLKNAVANNSLVLFLGAGFSANVTNVGGKPMPLGWDFAAGLWKLLGYSGDYDNTDLQTLYEAALRKLPAAALKRTLEDSYIMKSCPDWYAIVPKVMWYRVYTTNIDNVLEGVYAKEPGALKLDVINGVMHDFRERDQFLSALQYIKLNGSLPCDPKEVTFAVSQYASRMNQKEPWYDHFVRDYATRPAIFIGSKLNEPLLYQAIAARKSRFRDHQELRPRSFLIARQVSEAQLDSLKEFNVVPLIGTAEEFFLKLQEVVGIFPKREEVLVATNPSAKGMLQIISSVSKQRHKDIIEFYKCFHPVKDSERPKPPRKLFLRGAEPQWSDIQNNLDAPRQFCASLVGSVEAEHDNVGSVLVTVHGSAGSGKSTSLKRVAIELARKGRLVFFTDCEELPATHQLVSALSSFPKRAVLVLDNISLALGKLVEYVKACRSGSIKVTFVVAGRTSKLSQILEELKPVIRVVEEHMPDLSDKDIEAIIAVLEQHGQLGKLANKTLEKQREVFRSYAKHQLLVALRWATLGQGFDDIIRDEFLTTEPVEAKMLYLIACLASSSQFSLAKQQLLSCSSRAPAEALALLHFNLKDVIVPSETASDRYSARHRAIADVVVDKVAPRAMLKEAYIRLLKAISHDLKYPVDPKSKVFRLYRRLISHSVIYKRFSAHIDDARQIYETLSPFLKRDYQYLLQYGCLELEYGELDVAANYIEQAFAYAEDDDLVINTRGHLLYKQAIAVNLKEAAERLRDEAREVLFKQHHSRQGDVYPLHMICSQELAWINHWEVGGDRRHEMLSDLYGFAKDGAKMHVASKDVQEVFKRIKETYLELGIVEN